MHLLFLASLVMNGNYYTFEDNDNIVSLEC